MAKITEAKLAIAIALRDSAIALLEKGNAKEDDKGRILFERHTATNPEPRLSICLSKNASHGSTGLDVWGTVSGKHSKALNIRWINQRVDLVSFRRGEWENELLAMAGVMPVH